MKRGRAIALAVLLAVIATVAAFMALRPRLSSLGWDLLLCGRVNQCIKGSG